MLTDELRLEIFLGREQILVELTRHPFKIFLSSESLACCIRKKLNSVSPIPCSSFGLEELSVSIALPKLRDP
jgi:hypothetical protein